jgi:O-acetyl-ADP-ribose deacetylase (regulator of RNase III)
MPTKYMSGDLFDNAHHAQAFAHGCNCQVSMGGGIAKRFRSRYPAMYEEYRKRCKAQPKQFNLGECWLWKSDNLPWVFNLGTQEGYWRSKANYEAIESSLRSMRRQADDEKLSSIAVPRIGVGYGGCRGRKSERSRRQYSAIGIARWRSMRNTFQETMFDHDRDGTDAVAIDRLRSLVRKENFRDHDRQ